MAGRIVVIVNKKWEAAPILGVFSAPYSSTGASSRPGNWGANSNYRKIKKYFGIKSQDLSESRDQGRDETLKQKRRVVDGDIQMTESQDWFADGGICPVKLGVNFFSE